MAIWELYRQKKGWRVALTSGKTGTGDWSAFDRSIDEIRIAAKKWNEELGQVQHPWLCWSNNEDWCIFQQKIVQAVGWTPVVGWDPNCIDNPKIVEGAIAIDFNRTLKLKAMWPHFPLEFVFLWAPRLAFWHSDLLVRLEKLQKIANIFKSMKDGEIAAVRSFGGIKNWYRYKLHRYWELMGCTTYEASLHQFQKGCGWWRNFHLHPNTLAKDVEERSKYYSEHGVGIMYWKRKYHRRVINISEKILSEGHCTRIGNKDYITDDDKGKELALNFNLQNEAIRLGLREFL